VVVKLILFLFLSTVLFNSLHESFVFLKLFKIENLNNNLSLSKTVKKGKLLKNKENSPKFKDRKKDQILKEIRFSYFYT